jgi:hydroxypyruvate isomerase
VDHPRVNMLFDVHHLQVMGGDILTKLESGLKWLGPFHFADGPGRHQPRAGELCLKRSRAGWSG